MPATEFLERIISRLDRIDRKSLEHYVQDLARQTQFLTSLINQSREGILVLSFDKETLFLNHRIIQLFNIPEHVKQKEKLKKLRHTVDVLTMTATPIPRTLYMSLMAAKDMSILNTPPPDRQSIKTTVAVFSDDTIRQAAQRELARGGQGFFIHNRIEDIGRVMRHVARLAPGARIGMAHGRMPANELENVMMDFIHAKLDVLVCTNIIESGIDIPNANTILINRADTFGLADLYQLRGRVGRFRQAAYAYFLVPKGAVLDKPAKKRLRAVSKWTALGSGFKIAMEDLQLRGAGNLLGEQQHGYIEAVGFDLYCRLLKSAVSKARENSCIK